MTECQITTTITKITTEYAPQQHILCIFLYKKRGPEHYQKLMIYEREEKALLNNVPQFCRNKCCLSMFLPTAYTPQANDLNRSKSK